MTVGDYTVRNPNRDFQLRCLEMTPGWYTVRDGSQDPSVNTYSLYQG